MRSTAAGTLLAAPVRALRQFVRHPLAGDAALLAFAQYAAAGLGLLTTLIAARALGPVAYGVAALAIAYPSLLLSVVAVKSMSVTTRYVAAFRESGDHVSLLGMCRLGYTLDLLVATLAWGLVLVTGWWVAAHVYRVPETARLMAAYGASLPFFSLAGTSWAILSVYGQFSRLAALLFAQAGITLLLVWGLLAAGLDVWGLVAGTAGGQALTGVGMAAAATVSLRRAGVGGWWQAPLRGVVLLRRELAAFLGWNYVAVALSGLLAQVPLMLLGVLHGPRDAGYFRLASGLATTGSYLETSLARTAYPVLSARWGAGEREELRRTAWRWTGQVGVPAGVLLLVAIPLLPWVTGLVFGPAFLPMVRGAQVMLAGAAVGAVFFWLAHFHYAAGRAAAWTKAYGLYTVIVLTLVWSVIRWWGFLGLAILVTVGRILFTVAMAGTLRFARRVGP